MLHISLIVYETIREICKICEQYYYHFIGWRNDQNKSCRSQKVMKHCSSQLFNFKSSCQEKLYLNFQKFEIWIFWNDLGWTNSKNKSYRSRKVMKLCCLQPFHLKWFTTSKCCLKFNFEIVEELWFLFLISS